MKRFGGLHTLTDARNLLLRFFDFRLRPSKLIAAQHLSHFRQDGFGHDTLNGSAFAKRRRRSGIPPKVRAEM